MPTSFRKVSSAAIASYQREGAVCLRQIIDDPALDPCRRGVKRSIANPGSSFVTTRQQTRRAVIGLMTVFGNR